MARTKKPITTELVGWGEARTPTFPNRETADVVELKPSHPFSPRRAQ